MKKDFQEQFENMRDVIKSNISTIQLLLKQSDQLSAIICKIDGGEENALLKQQLEDAKNNILQQLNALVDNTKELYKAYSNLVDKIFNK